MQDWLRNKLTSEIGGLGKLQVLVMLRGTASHVGGEVRGFPRSEIRIDEQRGIVRSIHESAPELREVRVHDSDKWNFLGSVDGWQYAQGVRARATLLSA